MAADLPDIEFWFDFSSPYAYFAYDPLEELATRHGRAVRWRPFLLGPVLQVTGMRPVRAMPLRGSYAERDWLRMARLRGIPFRLPDVHPFASVAAGRAFYAVAAGDEQRAIALGKRMFQACYAEGQEISELGAVSGIAATMNIDESGLRELMQGPVARQALRDATDEAIARGIFGSPFFLVEDEPFWGADRLPMMDEWLGRGGW